MELVSIFVDKRIKTTGKLLFSRIISQMSVCLRQLSGGSRATEVRFGRWLRNKNVTPARLIETEVVRVAKVVEGLHILSPQDTTELNYEHHAGQVSGLGPVGNGKDRGLFLHPLLVLDAETGGCLGCAGLSTWIRPEADKISRHKSKSYKALPIEEKESRCWIDSAEKALKKLEKAASITFIGDRESDIYDAFYRLHKQNGHILVRSRGDRRLASGATLKEHTANLVCEEVYEVMLSENKRKKRKARKAELEIRYSAVEIRKPSTCHDKHAPLMVKMYVVEAREVNCPEGEKPLHWRLLTSHRVEDIVAAKQIIFWYQQRWNIEQVFRTMKRQGLDIESSQVSDGESLTKLAIISLFAAIQILQLVRARDGNTTQKIGDVFTEEEVGFLKVLLHKVEGKTAKQKNGFLPTELAWGAWIIAKLGGWKGYKSEAPPGPITMRNGLQYFRTMFAGWSLNIDLCIA